MNPPVIKTFPVFSRVAVCPSRGRVIEPVALNVLVDGSYSSALERAVARESFPLGVYPPAIRTFPSGSKVAVCPARAVIIVPVRANLPVSGSYNSALAQTGQEATLSYKSALAQTGQ